MSTMPVYFVSHGGGPWPYVESMRQQFAKTEHGLAAIPDSLPTRPKAILVISGHWESTAFTVSTALHPPMVYDYGGFPPHTYQIRYPAPGSPDLAGRVATLLERADFPVQEDAHRGFDHGTFVPLVLMYPDADVPVVTLSMRATYDAAEHIRVGQALAPLRREEVLILGSGLTYHNMRGFGRDESGVVARTFQQYLDSAVSQPDWRTRNDMLSHWESAEGARLAHPKEDHLLPLLVVAGAAGEDVGQGAFEDHVLKVPMASYVFGAQ